jgi:type IV pilus assembly protein PilF
MRFEIPRRALVLTLCAAFAGCVTETTGVIAPKEDMAAAAALNITLGFEYLFKNRRADAVLKFEKAIEQDPDNAQAYYGMALVHEQVADHKQARKAYETAASKAPDDAAIRNAYGTFLCRRGEHKAAQEAFMAAARNLNYRTPAVAYTNAAICAREGKDLAGAEAHLRSALSANPRHPQALYEMADLQFARGEPLRSRAFLQRLREEVRPDARTLLLSYQTEQALGDERTATRFADQLRRDFPNSPEVLKLDEAKKK